MILRPRLLLAISCGIFAVVSFCALRAPVFSAEASIRRLTFTAPQTLSINPTISGDGSFVAFESTSKDFDQSGANGFRLLRATTLAPMPATQFIALTRAPAPAVSQHGGVIAFASTDDPLGTNPDRNSEIFVFNDGAGLRQITNTAPRAPTQRATDGNFNPSISDDGRFIAFASNRDISNRNSDFNREIILYDDTTKSFAQLTDTRDAAGSTDAKISGDASTVAFIFDSNNSTQPNALTKTLMLHERSTGRTRTVVSNRANFSMTYGRAISDDGTRIVFSANTATNASQVFLYDARTNLTRQLTTLGSRSDDVPLHPTIGGDGSRIAFATRRAVRDIANADRSTELYVYDLPLAQFSKITDAPAAAEAEVVASINDDGSLVAFNFPRLLSATTTDADFAQNSEIYLATLPPRPPPATNLIIRNAASLDNAAQPANAIAPDSIAVARGTNLAIAALQASANQPDSLPTQLAGTSVHVNARPAQIFAVSPTQISFIVPPDTPFGATQITVTNADGLRTTGFAEVMSAAPGIFTASGDGAGEAIALDAKTFRRAPFDSTGSTFESTHILIFSTGTRGAATLTATIDGKAAQVERILNVPDLHGLDQIEIALPRALLNRGRVALTIIADGHTSNLTTLRIAGLTFNEILADPPDALAGDANRDGVRSASADEFIELVNSSSSDLDIGGFEVRTIDDENPDGVVRHKFESETVIAAGTAIVIFGDAQAATFDSTNPVFGDARVVLASSGGLSLINGGGRIVLRGSDNRTIDEFVYGSAGGISGNRNQSITRQPDTRGDFILHSETFASLNRLFSPGTRTDGAPFVATPAIARITVEPASTELLTNQSQQFTARAFGFDDEELAGVNFTWQTSNASILNIDANGLATAKTPGTASVTASARGRIAAAAQVTITAAQPSIIRVEVSRSVASINRGAVATFTARAFNRNNAEVSEAVFEFSSSNPLIASIETGAQGASAIIRGTGIGRARIRATTSNGAGGTVSGEATMDVKIPLVINEILADVPPDDATTPDIEGDANRDGVRNSGDDEFIELLNASAQPLDISGIEIADATATTRFKFAANTVLGAGGAVVVFGGGNPPDMTSEFGGAQVFKASALSFNDGGDTVRVSLKVGTATAIIVELIYGANPGDAVAPRDQSLTRSPDAGGDAPGGLFLPHSAATNAEARPYSPGTRADGTPFGSPAITRIEVAPASTELEVGARKNFNARAFAAPNGIETEIPNVSFIWQPSIENRLRLQPRTGNEINAIALERGTIELSARAGGISGGARVTVTPIVASVVLIPDAVNVFENEDTILRATARDADGVEIENLTFAFLLRDASPSDAAIITATTADTITLRAQKAGGVNVTASYTRPGDGVMLEATARVTIATLPPRIVRVELTPAASVINRGGSQSFTARAFDENGNEATSQNFTFATTDAAVATINAAGIARGAGVGTITVRATTSDNRGGTVTGEASLTVRVPVVINEILADVPVDDAASASVEGDANRDGARNSDDDEFIELVNASARPLDVSGIRFADATTTRFTFPANMILTSGQAAIVFGGGTPHTGDPAFGGSLVFTTGSLSLNDSGDTINLRVPLGSTEVLVATQSYGANGAPPAAQDESLVRSPDAASDANGGAFLPHRMAVNSFARVFSPGTRADGTPFNSNALTRIEVIPATTEFEVGSTRNFTARGFTVINNVETEVPNVSFIWSADAPERIRIAPLTGASTIITGAARGAVELIARAGNVSGNAALTIQPVVALIELTPATQTINETEEITFTATARDAQGEAIAGKVFSFTLRDASPVDAASITSTTADTVMLRGVRAGTVNVVVSFVRASDNVTFEDSSLLTIRELPPRIVRVEVTPTSATINRGGTTQFSARAFDEAGRETIGATFNFTSSETAVATIDDTGLARGAGKGAVVIRAATSDNRGGMVTGEATLTVNIPISINEIFADVPTDVSATLEVEGDANRDGVRSADDDEFIEIVNVSAEPVELSGIRAFDSTNVRFTFPANTTLAPNRAAIIFGGGAPPSDAGAFGDALVFTTTSLSLNDTGDSISLRLPLGATEIIIATQSYGTSASGAPAAPSDQSLVRSPDAGDAAADSAFVPHTAATNAANRIFSAGTRSDGTPFGSPPITRIEVAPAAANIDVGASQTFTARAFATLTDNTEVEVPNVSFIWDATDDLALAPRTGRSTTVNGSRAANATVRAQAGGLAAAAQLTVNAVVASVELTPETASVTVGGATTFTASARDASGNVIANINFVFSILSSTPSNAATITNQTANTVTLRGDVEGTATVLARYTRPSDAQPFDDTATLNVGARPDAPRVPSAGEVVINEAVVAFTTSTTQARADFLELYNRTARALDISGLVVSFRPAGSSNTPRVITLPGAPNSGTTLIEANGYFVIANGANVFGETRVYDASASNFDLNNTTGGILIEVNSVKLDGLSYQGGSTAPAAIFISYGEGNVFTFASGTTNDLVRQPNGADNNDNAVDFRRNPAIANVSPRAVNPTIP